MRLGLRNTQKGYAKMIKLEDLDQLAGQTFVLDTETNGLHWYEHGLIGVAIHCPKLNLTGYLPTCDYIEVDDGKPKAKKVWLGDYEINPATGRKRKQFVTQIEQKTKLIAHPNRAMMQPILDKLSAICNNPKTCVIAHNAKFDLHFCGLDLSTKPCMILDTSVMVHLVDSRQRKSLEAAEMNWLAGASKRTHLDKAPKGYPKDWPLEVTTAYAINDAIVTFQLCEILVSKMRELGLVKLFMAQMRFLRAMWSIERRGLLIDAEFSNQAIFELTDKMRVLETKLQDAAGNDFNWRSSKQLSEAIYGGLGVDKPTIVGNSKAAQKVSNAATSAFALAEADHPLKDLILDLREVDKLIKNLQSYLELSQFDGAIHTSFNLTGAVTGRLSSSEPNIQNVASTKRKRDSESSGTTREGAYNTRNAFIARPGHTFIAADHAQQEIRMLAFLAQEPTMLAILRDKTKDIHMANAIHAWGDCGPELNAVHRTWAKSISFALPYGMSRESMEVNLVNQGIAPEKAGKIFDDYFGAFPGLQPWMNEITERINRQGFIRYWSGRYWRPEYPNDAYKGVNAVIQGGCADIVALAVARGQAVVTAQEWGSIVSIIHDEIIFEIADQYVATALPVIASVMQVEDALNIPFVAELKIGQSYGSLQDIAVPAISVDWKNLVGEGCKLNEYSITGAIN